jgi:hypothetical protein
VLGLPTPTYELGFFTPAYELIKKISRMPHEGTGNPSP